MRLLHTRTLRLEEFHGSNRPPYAILSHRWTSQEVRFEEVSLLRKKGRTHLGARKILDFCQKAAEQGLNYGWVDTCAIDKSSSAELSEAINSMYDWYRNAKICFVYLADVALPLPSRTSKRDKEELPSSFPRSDWFKRGWTLQELVAPSEVEFYSSDWQLLGTKSELKDTLSSITRIDQDYLLGADITRASIAKRMSWASRRVTTRKEDIAYSLLGIFGVNMPLLYGEGERAFVRLQEEIMKISDDQSLFAWSDILSIGDSHIIRHNYDLYRSPLARSPADFTFSGDIVPYRYYHTGQPYAMTNLGLRIELPLHSLRNLGGIYLAELACHRENDYTGSLGIYVRAMKNNHFGRVHANKMGTPVPVNPQLISRTNHAAIYLRTNSLVQDAEVIDRHHGMLVRVHDDCVPSYRIHHVSPQDHWHKKTKDNCALILQPTRFNLVTLTNDGGSSFALLLGHQVAQTTDKGAIYEAWEAGDGRCRLFLKEDSEILSDSDQPGMLSYYRVQARLREKSFDDLLKSSCSKTFIDLSRPKARRVVAEMRKDTIMGERMIVVDITFYDAWEGLHELHGESTERPQDTEQDPTSLAQDGLPPSSVQQSGATADDFPES